MRNAFVLTLASVSAAAALVLGGAAAADAATPSPAPDPGSSSSCSFAQHLVHDWFTLPTSLRTDLKEAKSADSKAARLSDLKKIRTKALAGGYGKAVEARAEHLKSLDLRPLPDALKADLKEAKSADSKAARLSDLKKIRTKALAGGYGKAVEARAEHLKSLDLRPLPDALKADLKTLRGEPTKAAKVTEAGEIASKAVAGDYGDAIQSLAKQVQSSKRWQSCTPKGS